METKQIIFTSACVAELLDVECEAPKANEVTVELEFSAISAGTEKANYVGMRNGPNVSEEGAPVFPRTVGYSAAGHIIALGEGIDDLAIGDKVVVYWGKHKKHITVGRDQVVKIPEGVSTKEASMALISTFPLAAIRKTKLEIGESALVMGLGILGIFPVSELKAAGAYPIIAVDPVQERRNFALKMGADYALDPTDAGFTDKVLSLSCGGVNVCVEVTGLGVGLVQALDCMKMMGRVALLGCTRNSKFEVDYYAKVHGRGVSLIGAHTMARPKKESAPSLWTDEDDLKTVLALIRGKRLDFASMICEIHSPEKAQEVYTRLVNEKNFPIGVLFDWSLI